MCFAHAHGVMREVDIAIVACLGGGRYCICLLERARSLGEMKQWKRKSVGNLQKSARLSVLYRIGGGEGEDWETYI